MIPITKAYDCIKSMIDKILAQDQKNNKTCQSKIWV